MFLKKTVVKQNGEVYRYYAIAESYRDERGRIQTRYVRRLGALSDAEAEWWRTILSSPVHDVPKSFVNLDSFVCNKSLSHGIPVLADATYSNLGLKTIISESLSRIHNRSLVSRLTEVMIVNRLDDPCSKLALLEWLPRTSLPFLLGLPRDDGPDDLALNENSFYRAMDVLWERRDGAEKMIYERIVKPLSKDGDYCGGVLAKDITSTYFEGDYAENAAYGYSRDHRHDLRQVTFSIIETDEGYPITLEVYPGNTVDKATVTESVTRLKRLFGITRGIFVFDRGMVTEENMEFVKGEGFSYIVSELVSKDEVREAIEEALKLGLEELKEKGGEGQTTRKEALKARDVTLGGVRYIVVHDSTKERRDIERLERMLAKAEKVLSGAQRYVEKYKKKMSKEKVVVEYVSRKLQRHRLFPYFEKGKLSFDENSTRIIASYDEGKIEREKRYAGIWVLSTDLPAERKRAIDAIKMYRGLWVLENTFRTMKSSLDLRPMWHRKDQRIRAHIWICMIAYLIERIVEDEVRKGLHHNDDDRPITAARIFESFRNVMLNENGFRDDRARMEKKWWVATELDKDQMEIVKALRIDPGTFKPRKTFPS